jgi:hypothetical protein
MGRPKPSQEVLDFAVAISRAVTAQSTSMCDFVARSGNLSLYALLGRLAPKVRSRDPKPERHDQSGELRLQADGKTADKVTAILGVYGL